MLNRRRIGRWDYVQYDIGGHGFDIRVRCFGVHSDQRGEAADAVKAALKQVEEKLDWTDHSPCDPEE